MIEHLRGDALAKPRTVAAEPVERDPEAGAVTSDIARGELFVQRKDDAAHKVRLRWEPGAGTLRELPAGTWVVTGYRRIADADDGAQWIWSTTSPGYREIRVAAGETTHVDVRRAPAAQVRAFRAKNGQHRVGITFVAEERLGHTLYRGGTRIALTWQCLDAEGAVLAEGGMQYG